MTGRDPLARIDAARRLFLRGTGLSLGAIAFETLAAATRLRASEPSGADGGEGQGQGGERGGRVGGVGGGGEVGSVGSGGNAPAVLPHFRPHARRVVFLCQSGAPSQVDLFDPKPNLRRWHGQELPASVRGDQRLTTMTADQPRKPIVASPWDFTRYGDCGLAISDLLPYTGEVADDLCVVRSVFTEAINHDPAITYMQTGSQIPGRPEVGSVAVLWNWQSEPGFARLRGAHFAVGQRLAVAGVVFPLVGFGICADPTRGRFASFQRRSGPLLVESAGRLWQRPPLHA